MQNLEKEAALPYELASTLFRYDAHTGIITILCDLGSGTLDNSGYRIIKYKDRNYKAHRLAWLLYYKEWPKETIDHIDYNRSNNRISNLRDVPASENRPKPKPLKPPKPPYVPPHGKGYTCNCMGKWVVRFYYKGERGYYGSLNTEEQAIARVAEVRARIDSGDSVSNIKASFIRAYGK